MKHLFVKFLSFVFRVDERKFYPEKWDLSQVHILKEYGGNDGFVDFYKDYKRSKVFVNGIFVYFEGDSWEVTLIVGYTSSAACPIGINKKALGRSR